jgi:hypothetical protein
VPAGCQAAAGASSAQYNRTSNPERTTRPTLQHQAPHTCTQAVEDADADAFTGHVAEFDRCLEYLSLQLKIRNDCDSMSRLDKWRTTLLLTIKKKIGEQDFS